MKRKASARTRESGVALLIALMTLLILSTLVVSLIFVTQTEIWASSNYRLLMQARYAAEAGAQNAANWFSYNYVGPANWDTYDQTKSPVQFNGANVVLSTMNGTNSNYSDAEMKTSFNNALNDQPLPGVPNATYSVTATLLSTGAGGLQTWQITSQGNITGVRNAQVQVTETIERTVGNPVFTYAVFGTGNTCGNLTLSGGAFTDSFDSSAGTAGEYAATKQSSGGNIGSNGNVTLGGATTTVNGGISVLNTNIGSCASGADITSSAGAAAYQTATPLSGAVTFPNPPAISPAPPTTNQNYTADTTLPPGDYGNVNMSGNKILTLSPGTYNLNSLVLSGNSALQISPPGQVIINIEGAGASKAVDLSGGTLTNTTYLPSDLQFNYGGSQPIDLSGGSGSYAVVYAPNCPITISGGGDWYGAVIGKSFTDSGGSAVHYDRGLLNNAPPPGKFNQIAFSWSKF